MMKLNLTLMTWQKKMVIIEETDSNSTKFEPNSSTRDDNDAQIDNMCHNSRKNSLIYNIIIRVFQVNWCACGLTYICSALDNDFTGFNVFIGDSAMYDEA